MRRTVPDFSPDGLKRRLQDLERSVADLNRAPSPIREDPDPTPLPFHWPGAVADHVDVRNGPGEFGSDGLIHMVRYRWDTAPTSAATVEWELDGVAAMTHTLPASTNPHAETPGLGYMQQALVAIVTADGGGEGLTAFVYFR